MEIEMDRSWLLRVSVLLIFPLLVSVYVVGAAYTPYDRDGRAILLSRDMLEAQRFVNEVSYIVREMRAVARELEEMTVSPRELSPPHERTTPIAAPAGNAALLLERTRAVGMVLRQIQVLTRRLEETPAPEALLPVRRQVWEASQGMARWGAAVADYLTLPTQEGWERVQVERRAALDALQKAEEALR